MKFGITLVGLEDLKLRLNSLPVAMRRRIIRRGVGEGTQVLLKAAKSKVAAVPKRTGLLKKSLGRKVKTYREGGTTVGIVGPRKGFRTTIDGQTVDPVRYAHLVELGTRPHEVNGRRHPGARAQPFMRPAFDESKSAITRALVNEIKAGLFRHVAQFRNRRLGVTVGRFRRAAL